MLRSPILNVMVQAAFKAGRSLKRDFGEVERLQVSVKGPANFVSAADTRAEEILRQELEKARPGYSFVGEEGGRREGSDKSHTWFVDPLDGTTNFLHGIPQFCISIGLQRDTTIIAGVIYNPVTDELFTAERGKGAVFNDRRLRVAARKNLSESIAACGLPHLGRGDLALFRREFAAVQPHVAGLRRFGAAALDLAWIAAGRLDIYWERGLKPWDLAAGILMVREAGGFVTDLSGKDEMLQNGEIIAGNETMHREVLRLLRDSGKPAPGGAP
jgi:myo-inositol-1(or 4)-monophosphatase